MASPSMSARRASARSPCDGLHVGDLLQVPVLVLQRVVVLMRDEQAVIRAEVAVPPDDGHAVGLRVVERRDLALVQVEHQLPQVGIRGQQAEPLQQRLLRRDT